MMDESRLTEYYSEIANKLDEMIPCEWERVVLYAMEVGNWSFATFYFYTADGAVHHWGDIPEEYDVDDDVVDELIDELTQINKNLWLEFQNSDAETWYSFTFDLDSDWKFKVKYGYEQHEDISGLEIEIRWAYDELGLIPDEKVERMLLKEYLEKQNRELPDELKNM